MSLPGFRQFSGCLALVALLVAIVGCSGQEPPDPTADWSVERFYSEAKNELDSGNYLTAIDYYETLESRFPFGRYATQAQIDVAYAYFKLNEPDSAIAAIDRFVKLHPQHESVDYAFYLKGLVNFERGGTILDSLSERDMSKFDIRLIENAHNDFRVLLQRFPDSKYAADARRRVLYLRDQLARADFNVANYYASREAWVAVANRTRKILHNFQGTSVIDDALELQLEAYRRLGLDDVARDTERIIELNRSGESG